MSLYFKLLFRCPLNSLKDKFGKCRCKNNMIRFLKQNKLHCEPCPVCKNCQGTMYLCENGPPYNYTGKPTCSNPPKDHFTKYSTFEKCRKPCGTNEYEAPGCGFCGNRICKCKPGFYHDSLKDCTKKCSMCLSTDSIRIEECDNVPYPEMVIFSVPTQLILNVDF